MFKVSRNLDLCFTLFLLWFCCFLASGNFGAFPMAQWVKNPTAMQGEGEEGLIPGSWRSPGEGHGNPLQYSCLENPMDRGTWGALVHRVANSWMQLKWLNTHTHTHYYYIIVYFSLQIYQYLLNVFRCSDVGYICI